MTDDVGNEVILRRKQFWALIGACVSPALVFATATGGFMWHLSDRMIKMETIGAMVIKQTETNAKAIQDIATKNATLERIDQRLIDIERRIGRIEGQRTP